MSSCCSGCVSTVPSTGSASKAREVMGPDSLSTCRPMGVTVVEVSRPSRQVRRRHGKSDVIDAIAAARAVLAGEATTVPKSHDCSVEALRTLKLLQRSANKARVVALNQLHNLVVTAPSDVRARLRDLDRNKLLATCRALSTDSQNFAPSPPVPAHNPRTSFSPARLTPIAA